MSSRSDQVSSGRSGNGGLQMIRKNGGDNGRERRMKRRHNMKVAGGKRKDNAHRVKEERIEEQAGNITREICELGYVHTAFSTLLVSIFISRMDNCQSWEDLEVEKSLRKLVISHVSHCKGHPEGSQETKLQSEAKS